MWADNMAWLAQELTGYFAAMGKRLHGVDPALYLMPNLAQWSHMLNIDTSRKSDIGLCEWWDTAMRGIDMRAIAPPCGHGPLLHRACDHRRRPGRLCGVLPARPHPQPEPGPALPGGICWSCFLYSDVYRFLAPEKSWGASWLSLIHI